MNRLSDAWFEFNDTLSSVMSVTMLEMPKRGVSYVRGKHTTVSGRDGTVFVSDGTYETIDVTVRFDVRDRQYVPYVDAWLRGSGKLRFSDEQHRVYDACVSKAYSRQNISKHLDGQRYTVTFTCQPFKYAHPTPQAETITVNGRAIVNPGTAHSLPRVKITGKGTFTVTIGSQTLSFENVTDGGIIVDSELMDALTYDGSELANDKFSGQPWQIQPGSNTVSWSFDDTELDENDQPVNGVTSIEILPRWRWR